MEYEVQDLNKSISEHAITLRLMNPVNPKAGRPIVQIGCSTCFMIAEINTSDDYVTVDDMKLVDMECNLHVEGFDTSWEPGELDDLEAMLHAQDEED